MVIWDATTEDLFLNAGLERFIHFLVERARVAQCGGEWRFILEIPTRNRQHSPQNNLIIICHEI